MSTKKNIKPEDFSFDSNAIQLVIKSIDKDNKKADKLKVQELVSILSYASDKYYNSLDAVMSDQTFDYVLDILKNKSPKNAFLKSIGAPIKSKDKVKLPFIMASLDKVKPDCIDVYNRWIVKYPGPYYLSDKLDGYSVMLWSDGKDIKLYSRGDGMYGQDISNIIDYINFGEKIRTKIKKREITIRGELIVSKQNFLILNANGDFKNARNAISGLVNSKSIQVDMAKLADFVAYSIVYPPLTYGDQINMLTTLGLNIVETKKVTKLSMDKLGEYFIDRRKNSPYEVDGIVIMDSSKVYALEETVKNPEHGFAFKMQLDDQIAKTKVISVEWECTKYWYLKPRVKVEPVNLVGVTIQYATAFNAKFVVDNLLGPDAVIELARSGDVIPDIQRVIKPAKEPQMPTNLYSWTKTGVDIIADKNDKQCFRIVSIKQITNFFTEVGIKYLSEGIVTKIFDAGYTNILKVLQIKDVTVLYKINGLGKKIIDKVFKNINIAMKTVSLDKLMAGSTIFGRGFGKRKFKLLLKKYPNILNTEITSDLITKIPGFDILTADQFMMGLPKFKKFFTILCTIYDLSHIKVVAVKSKKSSMFLDKKIVLTGSRDKAVEEFIEVEGGVLTSSVSKNTFMVIYTDVTSAKYIKAESLGITKIELGKFKEKYMQ